MWDFLSVSKCSLILVDKPNNIVKYYKLPYIGHISTDVKHKINRFCSKFYCKSLSIKIVLNPFKVADMFNMKDPIPKSLKYFVVYKFVCPGCNACYIGKTTRHLSTRMKGHLQTDKSPTFLHILLMMKLVRHLVLKIVLK